MAEHKKPMYQFESIESLVEKLNKLIQYWGHDCWCMKQCESYWHQQVADRDEALIQGVNLGAAATYAKCAQVLSSLLMCGEIETLLALKHSNRMSPFQNLDVKTVPIGQKQE